MQLITESIFLQLQNKVGRCHLAAVTSSVRLTREETDGSKCTSRGRSGVNKSLFFLQLLVHL